MKRRAPTLTEKVAVLLDMAHCSRCGQILGQVDIDWDHGEFHALGGSMGANLSPMHRVCHRAKTVGNHVPLSGDISKIAKVKRLERKAEEHRKNRNLLLAPSETKPTFKRAKRKIPSRPFQTRNPR